MARDEPGSPPESVVDGVNRAAQVGFPTPSLGVYRVDAIDSLGADLDKLADVVARAASELGERNPALIEAAAQQLEHGPTLLLNQLSRLELADCLRSMYRARAILAEMDRETTQAALEATRGTRSDDDGELLDRIKRAAKVLAAIDPTKMAWASYWLGQLGAERPEALEWTIEVVTALNAAGLARMILAEPEPEATDG